MRMNAKWLTPVLWSVAIVGTAIAAACGDGTASRSLFSVLDSAGRDSLRDSVPRDTTPPPPPPPPPDTIPPPPPDTGGGHVVRIVLFPHSQQRTVADTGAVYVVLYDSAGRMVRDSVTWALGDTTGVLRITSATMSSVMFETVGPGRAQLIAHHEALADTAVVLVVADSTPPPPPPPPPPAPVARIVVTPQSQQLEVGDSGAVTATLFDSGGTAVRGEVGWDLGAPSSVLRFLSWASSPVDFVAVGPGRARLIARYQALADTAEVVVVESPVPPSDPVTSIVVSPKRQERLVGDSGVVSASLRDSAGRGVWPGEINWVVDSSGVVMPLQVRTIGASWVVFDVRRAGTALLIARHSALVDTAVVVVH